MRRIAARRRAAIGAAALVIAAGLGTAPAGATGSKGVGANGVEPPPPAVPHPFGKLGCVPKDGIRFCQGGIQGTTDLRVPSFDGVPLDADVALPATGTGPFPLIVLLHGLGASKDEFENTSDDGQVDDVTLASHGYAVLMYTARGFGTSCGTPASRSGAPACAKGWIQLADQRYEIRDTQYLAGLLVDEGLVKPDIAVSGVSYGAGQSLELAMLKNRMRLTTGRLVPFVSPVHHVPMAVAAAYAMWPWDDLVTALGTNGHLTTTVDTPAATDIRPDGIVKESWVKLLYGVTEGGYLAPVGKAPQSTLTGWEKQIMKGEPYPPSELTSLSIIQQYKSAIGIPMAQGGPAPTAIQSGWTDTLFPVGTALHYAARVKADHEPTPMLLMFDDVGHGWAQNKGADIAVTNAQGIAFLDSQMLTHTKPRTGVIAIPVTCPKDAPSGTPVSGPSLASLDHGHFTITGTGPQTVTSTGGSPTEAADLNAAYTTTKAPLCNPMPATREPGTAVYEKPVGTRPVQLLGGPRVTAHIRVTGRYPEIVARLWDVTPHGTRQIVALGDYRPAANEAAGTKQSAVANETIHFELNPTDWTFPAGDTVELELVGSTAPLYRKSNGTFSVDVTDATVTLPVS
jgi:pimeloyl-ACP methyl ester carboxylesterase